MPSARYSCRLGEPPALGVAEEEPAEHLSAGRADHRDREVAAHGQMPLGHPVVRGVVAEAPVGGDVIAADGALAVERRREHQGVARHREAGEGLPGHPGERVEGVRLAELVDQVVEEGAERRPDGRGRRVGGLLDELVDVELRGQPPAHGLQGVDHGGLGAQRCEGAAQPVGGGDDRLGRDQVGAVHRDPGHQSRPSAGVLAVDDDEPGRRPRDQRGELRVVGDQDTRAPCGGQAGEPVRADCHPLDGHPLPVRCGEHPGERGQQGVRVGPRAVGVGRRRGHPGLTRRRGRRRASRGSRARR